MILPAGAAPDLNRTVRPSTTYNLDPASGRISGMIDGIQAVQQAVYKMLDTERFAYYIYSSSFGLDARLPSELENAVIEAVLQDDRITGIENFQMTVVGDTADISFTVVSIFGSSLIERSMGSNV